MPQPVSNILPNASVAIGGNRVIPTEHRPELALLAMKVLSEWSNLEAIMGLLFVKLLGANPTPGAAMYSSLNGGAARRESFKAVAETALSGNELEIFNGITKIYSSAAKERNKIAHWVWGYSPDIPNGVLLCDPNTAMKYDVQLEEWMQYHRDNPFGDRRETPEPPMDKIFVFYETDFNQLSLKLNRVMHLVHKFVSLIDGVAPTNRYDQQLEELLQEPEIREYVNQQHQRQNRNP